MMPCESSENVHHESKETLTLQIKMRGLRDMGVPVISRRGAFSMSLFYRAHILNTFSALLVTFASCLSGHAQSRAFEQISRFNAAEAHQGIGVDEKFFFAIGSKTIGKYNKETGAKIQQWNPTAASPLTHLDSGVVVDGKLYCAHSNYPFSPMTGSVEIWDTETLQHLGRHVFENPTGSCT